MKATGRIAKIFAAMLLALCFAIPASAAAELRIVTTVGDLGAMAREVVGEHGKVDVLARPTEDPHQLDPKPSFVTRLARADMLVVVGLDLEVGWLPTLLTGSRNAKIQPGQPGHFDASRHAVLQDVPAGRVDRAMGDVHPGGNPHFTTDPRQMARVALAFGQALGTIDPERADVYRERARNFARDSIRLAQRWEDRMAELPAEKRTFVSYHKAWTYVANWLGLEDVIQIEPKPGIAPNPRHVAQVVETIRSRNIPLILQSEYYPPTNARIIAQQTPATLVVVPSQTREGQRYVEHIEEMVEKIYGGLRGN